MRTGRPSNLLRCIAVVVLLVLPAAMQAQGVDNPLPMAMGKTSLITLDKDEQGVFKTSLPAGEFNILLDSRRTDLVVGNLISTLSVLDKDGVVLQNNAIGVNKIDTSYRSVAVFSLKQPKTVEFRILNGAGKADFWLTLEKKGNDSFVPLFGEIVPKQLTLGESKTGALEKDQDSFYACLLPKGEYKAILDFTNAAGQNTNIQGYLAFLDADGGNQENVIGFNQIDVAYRKSFTFSTKKDQSLVLRVQNDSYPVKYTLKLVAGSE